MSTHEILRAARALIVDPANWCRGKAADTDAQGRAVAPFCSVGAVAKALRIYGGEENSMRSEANVEYEEATKALSSVVEASDIIKYNDAIARSHECVLAAFDAAIEKTAPK